MKESETPKEKNQRLLKEHQKLEKEARLLVASEAERARIRKEEEELRREEEGLELLKERRLLESMLLFSVVVSLNKKNTGCCVVVYSQFQLGLLFSLFFFFLFTFLFLFAIDVFCVMFSSLGETSHQIRRLMVYSPLVGSPFFVSHPRDVGTYPFITCCALSGSMLVVGLSTGFLVSLDASFSSILNYKINNAISPRSSLTRMKPDRVIHLYWDLLCKKMKNLNAFCKKKNIPEFENPPPPCKIDDDSKTFLKNPYLPNSFNFSPSSDVPVSVIYPTAISSIPDEHSHRFLCGTNTGDLVEVEFPNIVHQ
jgi:hypothetical protein